MSITGLVYNFELVSLDPTDDSTLFTGIIRALTYADVTNHPATFISLVFEGTAIAPSIATAVMDESIPDGILQYGYPDVVTGSPVLTTGRPGWDAVDDTCRAVDRGVQQRRSSSDGAIWTATYASGDVIKRNPGDTTGDASATAWLYSRLWR